MTQLVFLVAVALFFFLLVGISIYYIVRARRAPREAWRMLIGRLQQVDQANVAAVALDLLEEQGERGVAPLDQNLIFDMLDGLQGLNVLEQNCAVLIDLAAYVQRWYPEALQLAEELRLNAREIQWHISRLRGASQTGHLREQFPIYAQRAVATYYLMTRSLLVLYEGVQLPEFAELQHAI